MSGLMRKSVLSVCIMLLLTCNVGITTSAGIATSAGTATSAGIAIDARLAQCGDIDGNEGVSGNADVLAYAKPMDEAKWIGPSGADLPFYPDYLPVFKIECDVEIPSDGGGSIIYGLNDPRLMNANLNVYNLENPVDSSGIRIEFKGRDKVSVFRYGYHPDDDGNKPLATFDAELKPGPNHIVLANNLGHLDIYVNGEKIGYAGINPIGNGGDYLAFPVLAEMAVEIPGNKGMTLSNLEIRNYREPGNAVYEVPDEFRSSSKVQFLNRSLPELKTSVATPAGKTVEKAEIICTARGIYDLYINGKRVAEDYFNPGSTQYNKSHQFQQYDITPLIKSGENEILARLGEGWWSGGSTFVGENWNFFGDRQSLSEK